MLFLNGSMSARLKRSVLILTPLVSRPKIGLDPTLKSCKSDLLIIKLY